MMARMTMETPVGEKQKTKKKPAIVVKSKILQVRLTPAEMAMVDHLASKFNPPISRSDLVRLGIRILNGRLKNASDVNYGDFLEKELELTRDPWSTETEPRTEDSLQGIHELLQEILNQVQKNNELLEEFGNLLELTDSNKEEKEISRIQEAILISRPKTVQELTRTIDYDDIDLVIQALKLLEEKGIIEYKNKKIRYLME